ncbi:MAG TPA: glycosyltransferase [Microbacterium sp.]|uniref:glycosyltransferase n=1 Tax=Microbacterium sp. TaxID=51671 RepID=UPI002C1E38E2|nr:glycosyltransferase [Microbacterium sp.]HWI32101.1 glycosyltransferase [Microbacterium sp.]
MDISVIIPTFNEGPNVAELLRRIAASAGEHMLEVIFVDDSNDDTPEIITAAAATASFPVRVIHRELAAGGLGGAVLEGVNAARYRWCLVMDGDLQHPPEKIDALAERASVGDVDVVVASRYADGGTSHGLATRLRTAVSRLTTLVTRAMFPRKLHDCTDPMTGYFLLDREAVDFTTLRPRGFKILLEILARRQLRIAEVSFDFAPRHAGDSKASFAQGVRFLAQLTMLRFGRMSAFALVGGFGALLNLAIMWALIQLTAPYIWAAVFASEITIITNFLMLEFLVFRDLRSSSGLMRHRFLKSFTFNNLEALIRIPLIYVLVEAAHIPSVLAAAVTLVVAFIVRFVFHALVVYAPKAAPIYADEIPIEYRISEDSASAQPTAPRLEG